MNNVIDFNTTEQQGANLALRNRDYNGADFGVGYKPLYIYPTGDVREPVRIDNKYASIREDNHAVLGIHSINYKAVTHKEMIDTQRDVIIRSGMADSSIQETISLDAAGKKCYVKHTLPNHNLTTPDGDTAALTFLSINSFCGTWAYQISAGAAQGACLNNQVWTDGAATLYKARHNRHLDIEHAAKVITNAVPIFMDQVDLWDQWCNSPCLDSQAAYIFASLLGVEDDKPFYDFLLGLLDQWGTEIPKEVARNRNFMYLWNKWNSHYRNALGANLWAVYNTMTDWGTHIQSKSVNVAGIQVQRSQKIQKVLNLSHFKQAA
jgi:hypothetical protein